MIQYEVLNNFSFPSPDTYAGAWDESDLEVHAFSDDGLDVLCIYSVLATTIYFTSGSHDDPPQGEVDYEEDVYVESNGTREPTALEIAQIISYCRKTAYDS